MRAARHERNKPQTMPDMKETNLQSPRVHSGCVHSPRPAPGVCMMCSKCIVSGQGQLTAQPTAHVLTGKPPLVVGPSTQNHISAAASLHACQHAGTHSLKHEIRCFFVTAAWCRCGQHKVQQKCSCTLACACQHDGTRSLNMKYAYSSKSSSIGWGAEWVQCCTAAQYVCGRQPAHKPHQGSRSPSYPPAKRQKPIHLM